MALFDDVAKLIARLAPRGWAALLKNQGGGLDLTLPKAQLAAELRRPLMGINRAHPGFEELCAEAIAAIEPGSPARSLLYHAFASPDVHPLTAGAPADADYPTLEDLDLLENYIFSLAPKKISDFQNPVIVVVACQYRTRPGAPHQQHADLAFSRTGVARVGSEAARYRGAVRSFDPRPSGGDRGFAAQPARYAAYIAEYDMLKPTHIVYRGIPVDAELTFTLPVHKLFAGTECLLKEDGTPLTLPKLKYAEFHINEKLSRLHRPGPENPGRIPPLPGFKLDQPPFVRTSNTSNDLVKLTAAGDSVLVSPVPNPLAETAKQTVNGKSEPVRFKVPKATAENRFWSSFQMIVTDADRAAPEYAHMRLEVTKTPAGQFKQRDLNTIPDPPPPGQKSFDKLINDGGYETAHLIDHACDGALTIQPIAALPTLEILPAFSLVTAVDYFPQVDQADIIAWVERTQNKAIGLSNTNLIFPQGGPQPLNDGRMAQLSLSRRDPSEPSGAVPNTQLPNPVIAGKSAFSGQEKADQTATAIVGWAAAGQSASTRADVSGASSWLPDAASDVFAPGWDVSNHIIGGRRNYVGYGLGSPFPEDSKLCAALNSFWPAVAPDSSRTYGRGPGSTNLLPTSIPLLDSEVGYHADHPRVQAGEVAASLGWDGDEGPFFQTLPGGQVVVNAVNPMRADQSIAAMTGRIGFSGLDAITSDEFIRRIEELDFCRQKVVPVTGITGRTWIVLVEKVADWQTWSSAVIPRAANDLKGAGFIFGFAKVDNNPPQAANNPPTRLVHGVANRVEIELSEKFAFWRLNGGAWNKITR